MNKPPGSGRLEKFLNEQWRVITLRVIGSIGAVGFFIQVIVFPVTHNPTSGTATQWCLVAALGLPVAGLLKGSPKE